MKIPIFKLEFDHEFIHTYGEMCKAILRSDRLTEGKFVRMFEEKFAKFIGVKHAIAR